MLDHIVIPLSRLDDFMAIERPTSYTVYPGFTARPDNEIPDVWLQYLVRPLRPIIDAYVNRYNEWPLAIMPDHPEWTIVPKNPNTSIRETWDAIPTLLNIETLSWCTGTIYNGYALDMPEHPDFFIFNDDDSCVYLPGDVPQSIMDDETILTLPVVILGRECILTDRMLDDIPMVNFINPDSTVG
jgi:hypothetical protein